MKKINEIYKHKNRPIKIVQFGEGNFLRAFADYMVDTANEAGVFCGNIAIVKPIPFGSLDLFHEQDNLYTVSLRGKKDGKVYVENRVISSIEKAIDSGSQYDEFIELAKLEELEFVISNTTEAGIVFDSADKFELTPPNTYPGKLTKFLYERFMNFNGDISKGLIILPVELIENNGGKLKDCVEKYAELWKLESGFDKWIKDSCIFCSTLVDRIVTGYSKIEASKMLEELGYEDKLFDIAEPFGLWVIESEKDISERFPLNRAGMPIVFTKNQMPYRERKVRILNGAHTSTVLAGYLMGKNFVEECMQDKLIRQFMERVVMDEIVPTLKLPREEVLDFAHSVFERFENPFVKHALLSISLNSVSKWKSRILPTFRDNYNSNGKSPILLTFSFASLLAFYTSGRLEQDFLTGMRNGQPYEIHDDKKVLEFFAENSTKSAYDYVKAAASNISFWGENLSLYNGFVEQAVDFLKEIRKDGMTAAMENLLSKYSGGLK